MELERLADELTVCKVPSVESIDLTADFYFIGKTDEEISLVCRTADTPARTTVPHARRFHTHDSCHTYGTREAPTHIATRTARHN